MLTTSPQPTRRSFLRQLALLSTFALLTINASQSQLEANEKESHKTHTIHASRTTDKATLELQHIRQRKAASKTTTFAARPSYFSQSVIQGRAFRNGSSDDFNLKVKRMHQLVGIGIAKWSPSRIVLPRRFGRIIPWFMFGD